MSRSRQLEWADGDAAPLCGIVRTAESVTAEGPERALRCGRAYLRHLCAIVNRGRTAEKSALHRNDAAEAARRAVAGIPWEDTRTVATAIAEARLARRTAGAGDLLAAVVDRGAAAAPPAERSGRIGFAAVTAVVGAGPSQTLTSLGGINELAACRRGVVGGGLVLPSQSEQGDEPSHNTSERNTS